MSLSCPDEKTILVTSAEYGQFSYVCLQTDVQCCPPNIGDDCVEPMEEAAPVDWALLKEVCDEKQACQLPMNGAVLSSCTEPSAAQYVSVFFQCFPGTTASFNS